MTTMNKNFWDKNAGRYDAFLARDAAAYERMVHLMHHTVQDKDVLELAAGTGLISRKIAGIARSVEATDQSPEMIAQARRDNPSRKLHFSVQDMFDLPYADKSFDVVIVSNALHIVPEPEKALREIRRVLRDDGALIAPTFTHLGNGLFGKIRAFFLKLAGFPLYHRWSTESYLQFLQQNGWHIHKSLVLRASFPLTYAECTKA